MIQDHEGECGWEWIVAAILHLRREVYSESIAEQMFVLFLSLKVSADNGINV